MLHEFLDEHRFELITRCRAKVALRPSPPATPSEMEHGIPLFLGQLIDTLRNDAGSSAKNSRNMNATAARHGGELLVRGFTIEQVVRDYGDLCQAITELAGEKKQLVGAEEFRTLNGCLDDAIAGAVTEFGLQRDQQVSDSGDRAMSERLAYIAHGMRSSLSAAILAFAAIREGHVGLRGATAEVLARSLTSLRDLIDRSFVDARLAAGTPPRLGEFPVEQFIADVRLTTLAEAKRAGGTLSVAPVEAGLAVKADKQMLYAALSNLLQNAFMSTPPHQDIALRAYAEGDRVLFEVDDPGSALSAKVAHALSQPPGDGSEDGEGSARGVSIARRAVEAMGGTLRARAMAGAGCVFTIDLPRHFPQPATAA